MPLYDIFLSHASADKPAVERLARKLREAGIEPFLDKWGLVAGESWQEALERAIAQSSTCAVFFGPVSKGGAWRKEETRLALVRAAEDASFRVIPVLLPGAKEDEVSGFLRLRTWFDFRAGIDDADAFTRFVASIRNALDDGGGVEKPPRPYRCMAPAREPFVLRSEYANVRDALLADGAARTTTVGITTAIHGAGGFGKTALAIELCHDAQVRAQYPDGILWTTMGEEIDAAGRLARVRDLIRWWTERDPPAFETVSAASAHLRQELDGKRVLLVVDDVWRSEDVSPFRGLGPRAALLVTTRDSRTLPADSMPIHVDAMEVSEAIRLLGASLPSGAEAELNTLATLLGEWPLLLKIVNRQVSSWISKGLDLREAIHRAENALKARGLAYFDPKDAKERSQASALTLEVSLERLSSEEQKRFTELAIFPEDTNVPLTVLEKLWQLNPLDVEELASRLFDLSLLRNFDLRSGTIRLHDVIRAYLLKRGEGRSVEWHRQLLDAFLPVGGFWPDLPPEESYLWNHLFHHLIGAGQSDHCRSLLLDFQYLRSKLAATDINALLADYSVFAEKDTELRLVRDALRLSAHVLTRNPAELRGQLWGRLLDRQEPEIRGLLETEGPGKPWLRLRQATLTRPGGALIRTIDHPEIPDALAVLPNGQVVSGSRNGTLRVWDVESGQTLQTLEGHSYGIRAVAVLDNCRVVSGSDDGTLRVWNVESGQTLQTLEGHSDFVRAVAVLDSRRVVSGSDDGMLRVWDVESGQTLQTLEGHSYGARAVAVLDSHRLVSGSSDRTLRVWDVESGQTLQILEGHSDRFRAVAVLDSRRVVSVSSNGTLRVWDIESSQTLQTLEGHSDFVRAVAVLDSHRVVSGSDDRTLRVWNAESGQTLQALEGHSGEVLAVAALDSRRVVSGSDDRTLRVWDVESSQTLQTLERHSDWVDAVAALDNCRVVFSSSDGTLRVWDVEGGLTLQTLEGHFNVNAVAVLDSRRVVFISDGTLRVWDVESGLTLQTFEGHYSVNDVAVLDSRRVVFSSSDSTLQVWDVESGLTLQTLEGYSNVFVVAVLDSRRVVFSSSDFDGTRVWDVESGQTLQTLQGHSDWVRGVAVLDSRRVVSDPYDGTLRVWDVESGQTLQTLQGHSEGFSAVAVDSRWVVSGSYDDRTLRVWNVESGEIECLFTLDAPVTAVAVSPDRRMIVAGDRSGRVHCFDLVEP